MAHIAQRLTRIVSPAPRKSRRPAKPADTGRTIRDSLSNWEAAQFPKATLICHCSSLLTVSHIEKGASTVLALDFAQSLCHVSC